MTRENGSWQPLEHLPFPGQDDIHLWQASLQLPKPILCELEASLSPDESERASSYRFPRDKHRFVAARGILRSLLGAYLGKDRTDIRFSYGPWGKPGLFLVQGKVQLHFNISHSKDQALFAFSTYRELGVDLEEQRPFLEMEAVAKRFLPTTDLASWNLLPKEARAREFFRAWTRQEAFFKARGLGLVGARGLPNQGEGWQFPEISSKKGFVATLAFRETGRTEPTCLRFSLEWHGRDPGFILEP